MTKRAIGALALLLVAGAIFVGFRTSEKQEQKDNVIISLVTDGLSNLHFKPKPLNDALSENIMKEYLDNLDRNKLFLIAADVKQLEAYNHLLDDEFKNGSSEFFDLSYNLLLNGKNRAESYYKEILASPLDFNREESTWNNPEKQEWAKNEKELRDYWRKYIKWRVANRIYNKEHAFLEDVANGDTVATFDFAKAETEARKDELELIDEWFDILKDMERIEWLGVYVNSFAAIFDPHTEYMPPQRQEDFEEQMTGQFEGIGAQLRQDGDYITVEKIITGSASWRQGDLEPGDKIIQVAQGDDEPVDIVGWKINKAVKIIRGKKGTEVRLTVKKKDGSRMVIPIIRDVVEIESTFAKSALLGADKKVGYIRLPSFYVDFYDANNHNCAEDVKQELLKLKAEGVTEIIFDLRGNGGGSLDAAIEIVGLFIERGPVVQVKSSNSGTKVKSNRDARVYWDGPLVVLVDQYSASASEIFAAAIQDYKRGIIIGSKSTFGKGTVQNMIDLDRAVDVNSPLKPLGALKITTEKFYRINGGTTQLQGVVPDIIMPDVFEFIKTGEKEYEFSLEVDEISPATYTVWNNKNASFKNVIAESQANINANPVVDQFKAYALWLKEQDTDKEIPLQYVAFKKMQDDADVVSKKYKDLNTTKDPMGVFALQIQTKEFETDTVKKADYERWHKDLSTDFYLHEAVNVVTKIK